LDLLSAWHVFGGAVAGRRDQRVCVAPTRANSWRASYWHVRGGDAAVSPVCTHSSSVVDGRVRQALRAGLASDLGVLSAPEHKQTISDPVARERCFELAGSLGDVGPAFKCSGITVRAPQDLRDISGVISG
jgi:hypothetical protein